VATKKLVTNKKLVRRTVNVEEGKDVADARVAHVHRGDQALESIYYYYLTVYIVWYYLYNYKLYWKSVISWGHDAKDS
jgi:hypothetical protein